MKRKTTNLNLLKLCLAGVSALIITGEAKAQSSQIGQIIQASTVDGNKILQAYANPFLKRQADGWADGWTYTAAHEKFSLNLVSVSASFVNNSDKTFDASTLGLSTSVRPTGTPINQTFAGGKNTNGAGFDIYGKNPYTQQDQKVTSFAGPDGINLSVLGKSAVPTVVTPQLGFGILPGTEVMIRFLPTVHMGKDASAQVLGFGLKQSISDLIFGLAGKAGKKVAPFDLAVYTGYSYENLGYRLDIEPSEADKVSSGNASTNYSTQKIQLRTTNYTLGALISKKILFITPHAGIAYSNATSTLSALGTYPVEAVGPTGANTVTNVVNPFLVAGANSGMSANLGVNLNIFFFKVNTDYIISKYSRLNVGLSISF